MFFAFYHSCLILICVDCVILHLWLHLGFWIEEGGANLVVSWQRNECSGRRSSLGWAGCAMWKTNPLDGFSSAAQGGLSFAAVKGCSTCPCSYAVPCSALQECALLHIMQVGAFGLITISAENKICQVVKTKHCPEKPSHFLLLFIVRSAL